MRRFHQVCADMLSLSGAGYRGCGATRPEPGFHYLQARCRGLGAVAKAVGPGERFAEWLPSVCDFPAESPALRP
jgi:hypothetical protein